MEKVCEANNARLPYARSSFCAGSAVVYGRNCKDSSWTFLRIIYCNLWLCLFNILSLGFSLIMLDINNTYTSCLWEIVRIVYSYFMVADMGFGLSCFCGACLVSLTVDYWYKYRRNYFTVYEIVQWVFAFKFNFF